MNTNTAAIESLRSFALAQCVSSAHPHDYANNDVLVRFAHLCTAAINGEEWAVERVAQALDLIACNDEDEINPEWARTNAINCTDTTRPDGAIARSIQI